jgi:hypothetical protein
VIVMGVLVALGVQNWASSRADRRLERQYLVRLDRDLRADSAMVADYQRVAVAGEAAATQLLALLRDGTHTVPDSVIARHFSDATRGAYLTPSTTTIGELESTGNLRVLRDDSFRDALFTYYAEVSRFQRSLETVMARGKDPLGELGWDIQAFDAAITYAVNLGAASESQAANVAMPGGNSTLLQRYRAHPDAERVTQRSFTYNGMLGPILDDWGRALSVLRRQAGGL